MRLEQNLPHQTNAVNAVLHVFDGIEPKFFTDRTKCPLMTEDIAVIKENIAQIQNGEKQNCFMAGYTVPEKLRENYTDSSSKYLNIDIKMETGTGKTYVYTKTMFELHRAYGINKFIVLVPTVPIKEGAKAFFKSSYMKSDLQSLYEGTELRIHVLDAQKQKTKGRKSFPIAIQEFAENTDLNGNKIDVLLTNSGMLNSAATMDAEYDQTLLGNFTNPYKVLHNINPFVIIDEPHKFNRTKGTFKTLVEKIQPQCIIRYGATFPEMGKDKIDYENVVYSLGACSAFNDNLVKGVQVEYIADEDKIKDQIKIKVLEINTAKGEAKTVRFQNEQTKKTFDLQETDSLSNIDSSFENIHVSSILKAEVELSNGMILHKSDSLYPEVFSDTFQVTMLNLALDRHFEKEYENFCNGLTKIKTLSLFFIDSIESFRNDGYLRKNFERLLKEKLQSLIEKFKMSELKKNREYTDYLSYSLSHLNEIIAGYFSEDNSTDSEDVKEEVDKVLRKKDEIIKIKKDNGEWEPTRFIFSKWTLKEGWDNPNIFVIAKLRSSGSETSKLQEVGRGLRLPVDELGERQSDRQFYLRYIIDYSEKDFAEKLLAEINAGADREFKITQSFLEAYAKKKQIDVNAFMFDLIQKKFITYKGEPIEENLEDFKENCPDLFIALQAGKIVSINASKDKDSEKVKIRKEKYDKLANLWKSINQKFYLHFDSTKESELKQMLLDLLKKGIDGSTAVSTSIQQTAKDEDGSVKFTTGIGTTFTFKKELPYSEFLKKAQKETNIPITLLHEVFCEYFKSNPLPEKFFSRQTLRHLVEGYRDWYIRTFSEKYSYEKVDVPVSDPLCDENNSVKEYVIRNDIGVLNCKETPLENYLYDSCAYDSDLEKNNITHGIKSNIASVEVYGKIPRRTVRIPTYADGTYSPDFMYVINHTSGKKQLNLVVETKDKTKDHIDPEERRKFTAAHKLFEKLKNDVPDVYYRPQISKQDMTEIIESVVKGEDANSDLYE
ncbi:type III restriction-modification system endonuclease [Treponema sp.]|uniref:type III restriction-modification system endonuclease n=1 Tax=Treponema sp. TaxID=166 RepID=UPI003EFCF78A